MDKNSETSVAIAAAIFLLLIFALTLCGCSTKKTFVETLVSHDTLVVHHYDTLRITHTATVHDTLREKEFHTLTLNNIGDTIKEIHHFYNSEKVVVVDSTNRYRSLIDSLQAVIKTMDHQKVTVKKTSNHLWIWLSILAILFTGFIIFIFRFHLSKARVS